MKQGIAVWRTLFIGAGLLIFFGMLFVRVPYAEGNVEALRILVTAFSILAGFLIAIITMAGDPKMLYPGSWKVASAHRRQIKRALNRYRWLFYVYLAVITLAFAAALFGKVAAQCPVMYWLERCALSLGVAALFWSFGLPTAIIRIQLDRLSGEVDDRRQG